MFPGAFKALCTAVFPRNVTEFSYRYHDNDEARILISFQSPTGVSRRDDAQHLSDTLRSAGYGVMDLSANELAKVHARHFVGGRSGSVTQERLYRFEFPEAPGALDRFLTALGSDFNVSLFHYRNHGSDFGRVLAGMQVPAAQRVAFQEFLDKLGYTYWDETENPVYSNFFGAGPS